MQASQFVELIQLLYESFKYFNLMLMFSYMISQILITQTLTTKWKKNAKVNAICKTLMSKNQLKL